MTAIATINAATLTGRQLDLIKRTIASDCNDEEFNLFIEVARRAGLDPFRKQISPIVFSKNNADRRKMAIIVGIDGQRVIAQRCGNYRPASEPTRFEADDALKGPLNPAGLVRAVVTLFQQDRQGQWWPVSGEAYWDEFVPLKNEWVDRRPTDRKLLDPDSNWARMPRKMLEKVATMQALRAGWPDEFGSLYSEEEMDQARAADMTATEILQAEQEEQRLAKLGGKDALMVSWSPMEAMERVPLGQFMDRVLAWIERDCDGPADAAMFAERNRETLREFWAKAPGDALELKKALEKAREIAPGVPNDVLMAG